MGDTEADAGCAPFSLPFLAEGVVYIAGPVRPPIRPPTRTTTGYAGAPPTDLCPEQRRGRGMVQTRSGILAHLCTRQHWLWVTVEPHIRGARHEEAVAREGGRYAPVRRVSGLEPLSIRTHRHRGRSGPLRSAVVEYQAPSVAVRLQLCARTELASGHSKHPVMQGSPPAHGTPRPCLRTTGQN